MTYAEFVNSLLLPSGVAVVVGVLLSIAAKYYPAYNKFSSDRKQLIFAGVSVLVALLGAVLNVVSACNNVPGITMQCTPNIWLDIPNVWFPALVTASTVFASGTVAYTGVIKKLSKSG